MLKDVGLNIKYEVKNLVQTIDFYNILLGEWAADLYPKHAIYNIKSLALTITFIENPAIEAAACGSFSLLLKTDDEVYNRFQDFTRKDFSKFIKIDPAAFEPGNHSFCINDPNGLNWRVSRSEIKREAFTLFNIPRMNSVWDILKPL